MDNLPHIDPPHIVFHRVVPLDRHILACLDGLQNDRSRAPGEPQHHGGTAPDRPDHVLETNMARCIGHIGLKDSVILLALLTQSGKRRANGEENLEVGGEGEP